MIGERVGGTCPVAPLLRLPADARERRYFNYFSPSLSPPPPPPPPPPRLTRLAAETSNASETAGEKACEFCTTVACDVCTVAGNQYGGGVGGRAQRIRNAALVKKRIGCRRPDDGGGARSIRANSARGSPLRRETGCRDVNARQRVWSCFRFLSGSIGGRGSGTRCRIRGGTSEHIHARPGRCRCKGALM